VLCISDCLRGSDLPGSGMDRMRSLNALKEYIRSKPTGAFGLDFPFGLSRDLVKHKSLIEFLVAFPNEHKSPEKFRDWCLTSAGGREKRRRTEGQAKTPFSPYNLRIYKQTFYGISAVLSPLVHRDLARILPVQKPSSQRPLLLEICPASTLKRLRLYGPKYKGPAPDHRNPESRRLCRNADGGARLPALGLRERGGPGPSPEHRESAQADLIILMSNGFYCHALDWRGIQVTDGTSLRATRRTR